MDPPLGEGPHLVGEGQRVGELGTGKIRLRRRMLSRSTSCQSGISRLSSAISASVT